MQSLYRHDYISDNITILDYGCGKGDDVRILQQYNINALGWDPVYFPNQEIVVSDIVNLGFVINVIEDQGERKKTLFNAYNYAKKLLVVAVMLGGESIINRFQPLNDGVVTARNTFQKYYTQPEIRKYIEDVLREDAIAIGPGIFYIFKDKIEEQNFLISREKSKKNWQRLSYTCDSKRLEIRQHVFYEQHKELLDLFWTKCLDLGRVPSQEEFSQSEQLRSSVGSHEKAIRLLIAIHGDAIYVTAAESKKNDLSVYFALGLFERRKPYLHMPDGLKRDIKTFWGKYGKALDQARELLFSAGKAELIRKACILANQDLQCGQLVPDHSFIVHGALLEYLPAVLRVYIGCASRLYGDVSEIDLIKIHFNSGKVTFLRYDDFWNKPLPLLEQRVKVKLREQVIDFFNYGDEFPPQPLYLKSILLKDDMPNYSKQKAFDKRLMSFEWLNFNGFGPSKTEFDALLNQNNMQIKGFKFYKIQ